MLHWSAGSCRSTSLPTERPLALPVFERLCDDFVNRPETSDSFVAAGEHPLFRTNKIGAALSQDLDIRNGCGVEPHFAVHRGGKEQRCFGGERDSCQSVVGKTVSELRNNVRGSGCNQKEIGVIGEFDMSGMPARLFVKDAGSYWIARQGLQRQWSNKLDRTRGHHHAHGAILLRQFAGYIGSLVGRNRSCHSEDDVHRTSFEFCVLRLAFGPRREGSSLCRGGCVTEAKAGAFAYILKTQDAKLKTQNGHSTFWTCSRIFSNSALQWTPN